MHEHQRFDDEAATWDDDPGHEKRQVAVAQAIKATVDLDGRMRAVDVGGGTGRLSILLADAVGSVVVTDPSEGMVRVARQRIEEAGLADRVRAVQADLTADRLDGTYEVVWSSMAFHHVPDLDALLRAVADLLVDRERFAEQLDRAGFGDVGFVDATTIQKDDREFGVFLCTATLHGR